MKNLKKLNRNELKTIAGGNWMDEINNVLGQLEPLVGPIISSLEGTLCNVQCTINGIVQVKLLPCGSTC